MILRESAFGVWVICRIKKVCLIKQSFIVSPSLNAVFLRRDFRYLDQLSNKLRVFL